MLHAGLDLSRSGSTSACSTTAGEIVDAAASPPDADGLRGLAARAACGASRCAAVIESMTGARFVHDTLEEHGWEVLVADAHEGQGAGAAGVQDRQDRRARAGRAVLRAIWCRRSGCPTRAIRRERELARYRLHLVRHRTTLKNRIHATLMTFGKPCPVSDLFGHAGRELLDRLQIPDPWRANVDASLALIDDLELQIAALTVELQAPGRRPPLHPAAGHRARVRLDQRATPIASEIGDIDRFAVAGQALRLHRALPARLPVRRHRPPRPDLQARPASTCAGRCSRPPCNACNHPLYAERYQRTKRRLGRQRGPKVAQIDLSRKLTEAIWHMLTRNQPFAPAGAPFRLAA